MELRNYSPQSIRCYSDQLTRLETHLNLPLDSISVQQLKDYLHGRIIDEKISVPLVNQTISAFKILQVDVLGREWVVHQLLNELIGMNLNEIISTFNSAYLVKVQTELYLILVGIITD